MSHLASTLTAFTGALADASTHKDGRRVAEDLLPLMAHSFTTTNSFDKLMGKTDDASMLVRLFLQGADPLLIGLMYPVAVEALEDLLETSGVMEGVRKAHSLGPASLLDGTGWDGNPDTYDAERHGPEVAWIILAEHSRDTEGGFPADWSLTARMADAFKHVTEFEAWLGITRDRTDPELDLSEALEWAGDALALHMEHTVFEDVDGIPTTDRDIGFYVGYKQGFPCVAVKAPGMTFYGTPPSTTLEAQGVTVDKAITPHFGIVFNKDGDQ